MRKRETTRNLFPLAMVPLLFCLSLIFTHPVYAQDLLPQQSQEQPLGTDGRVELEGRQIFTIKTNLGPFSKESRAKVVIQKLDKLLDDPSFDPEQISINETDTTVDVIVGHTMVASVTDEDAKLASKTKMELADDYASRLKRILPELHADRTMSSTLERINPKDFSNTLIQTMKDPVALNLVIFVVATLLVFGSLAFVRRSLSRYIKDSNTRYNARKIVTFAGYVICLTLALVIFRDSLGNVTFIVGAAAAGIAFALKEVIVSIAGWIGVTFGDFYKVGDRVEMAGIKGDVIDIGFARTTLMELGKWVDGDLYTGRVVRVSNSLIFNDPLFNYSRDFPFLWDEIKIPIKYGSDYELALTVFEEAVNDLSGDFVNESRAQWKHITRKYLVEDAQVEPMVTYAFNDNWVEYTVRYVVDFRGRRKTKFELHRKILKEIEARPDKLALASATFQLVEAPQFDVRMLESATMD